MKLIWQATTRWQYWPAQWWRHGDTSHGVLTIVWRWSIVLQHPVILHTGGPPTKWVLIQHGNLAWQLSGWPSQGIICILKFVTKHNISTDDMNTKYCPYTSELEHINQPVETSSQLDILFDTPISKKKKILISRRIEINSLLNSLFRNVHAVFEIFQVDRRGWFMCPYLYHCMITSMIF